MLSELIVVSGFPRTGTSTMMRMLHLGGMEVIADDGRMEAKHEFDPYGNYEIAGQTLFRFRETSPEETAGKAVKIVAPFIPEVCPLDRPIRVIFMTRDPNEIVASLLAMRVVWEWSPQEGVECASDFLKNHKIPVKYFSYSDMLRFPKTTALMVEEWLNRGLDIGEMAKAVDQKPREAVKGEGGQKRLVTYEFDRALVDDRMEVDLHKEEKS